jgi:rubrerythrin
MSTKDRPIVPAISTPAEFFAHALAIEVEASERYRELADQMATHNNPEVAAIFKKMADIEAEHHDRIAERAANAKIDPSARRFSWIVPEGPETTAYEDVHYLMNAHQALQFARLNEQRATSFFETIAEDAKDAQIKSFAAEMAEEERQHVVWLDEWLKRFPAPEAGWDEDFDPPTRSD